MNQKRNNSQHKTLRPHEGSLTKTLRTDRYRISIKGLIIFMLLACVPVLTLADEITISKPEAAPQTQNYPGTAGETKPSQEEGETAPTQNRPAVVPDFSLPEVVITAENEFTIGAMRLDRRENDVTLGSKDLTGLDRAFNDLPGLGKTMTALSTEESGPSRDSAFILHAGGGVPGTYGGWGLFGQELGQLQYIATGHASSWRGEPIGGGFNGDRKFGGGLEMQLFSNSPSSLLFSGNYRNNWAELPYQGSRSETREGLDLKGKALLKFSGLVLSEFSVSHQTTWLTCWDGSMKNNQARELEGRFKISAEDVGSFLTRIVFELGGRQGTSNFEEPVPGQYDWGWLNLSGYFNLVDNVVLTAKIQGQEGSGLDLPLRAYPVLDLMWRPIETSQLNLYWRNDRYVEGFNRSFMELEHISARFGFPAPTEISAEWGARYTQKIIENIVVTGSASTAQINNYHQWTELDPPAPTFIQYYSTLPQVRINRAAANLQWSLIKNWQLSATWAWAQGENLSGDARRLTALPSLRQIYSLYHSDSLLETRLFLEGTSETQAFETIPGALPSFFTLGLDATYHLSKTFSIWANCDNLLGENIQIQPGYLEPKCHVRGGIELIF
jgi:hypothetical protein